MEDKAGNWATVVNTGLACGLPRVKRIDSKEIIWIAVGGFTLAFPPHVWDYLVQSVEIEVALMKVSK